MVLHDHDTMRAGFRHHRIVPPTSARRQRPSHASRDGKNPPDGGRRPTEQPAVGASSASGGAKLLTARAAPTTATSSSSGVSCPEALYRSNGQKRERERFHRAKDCADRPQPPRRIIAAAPRQSGGESGHDAGSVDG